MKEIWTVPVIEHKMEKFTKTEKFAFFSIFS